jgi:serralysin
MKNYNPRFGFISALLLIVSSCSTSTTTTTTTGTSACSRTVQAASRAPISMCAAQNFPAKNINAYLPVKTLMKKEGPVAVFSLPTKWPNGANLKVGFMDDDYGLKSQVMNKARQWSNYANITFSESSAADADIRISFRGSGYWSVIGTAAKRVPKNEQTMNLQFWNGVPDSEVQRVTLHEFGHALGLLHEHESPLAQIPWDKNAVYKYYTGPPNCWSRSEVDAQVLQREKAGPDLAMTTFDKDSIMCYPVSDALTVGHYEIGWNTTLSETDKSFIAKVYPK